MNKKHQGALKNFVSIVPVHHPDKRGCEDTLVMAGYFNVDELCKVNDTIQDWVVNHNE